MTTATLVESPAPAPASASVASGLAASSSTEMLGEQIAALAARLHAATYELLVLLREFDRADRAGTTASCPVRTGSTWRTGIDLGRGPREGARRSLRLATLPLVSSDDAARSHLLRQGASADSRRYARQRGPCSSSVAQSGNGCARRTPGRRLAPRAIRCAAAQAESRHLERHLSHLGGRRRDDRDPAGRLTPRVGAGGPAGARGRRRPAVPRELGRGVDG